MKTRLYREYSGRYALISQRLRPIRARVLGTEHEDYYVPAGDPVGFRHMCEGATRSLTGGSCEMAPLDPPIDTETFIIPSAAMTPDLRLMILQAQMKAMFLRLQQKGGEQDGENHCRYESRG